MSDLVFPGANHSRFAHCVGVMHIARKMLDRAVQLSGRRITREQRIAVLLAALLHDVGHGPLSHAFEKVTGESHEQRTLEIIADRTTEVAEVLGKYDRNLQGRLVVFFDEDGDASNRKKSGIPEFLKQIVSSQLDADRFDYLLRDSHATGTRHLTPVQNKLEELFNPVSLSQPGLLSACRCSRAVSWTAGPTSRNNKKRRRADPHNQRPPQPATKKLKKPSYSSHLS